MKSRYDNIPPFLVAYTEGQVMINFNCLEDAEEPGKWECESLVVDKEVLCGDDYGNLVEALIRRKYTLSQELSIHRQRDVKPEEWETYNTWAEECKQLAKEIWQKK